MKKQLRMAALLLSVLLLLPLAACAAPEQEKMIEHNDTVISEGLYKYSLSRYKATALNYYKQTEDSYLQYYGAENVFGTPVADTEEFWNTAVPGEPDGRTFAQVTEDLLLEYIKEVAVYKTVSQEIGFDGISEENLKTIAETKEKLVEEAGSEAAFIIELAQYPITVDEWQLWEESQYYPSEIKNFLYSAGGKYEIIDDEVVASLQEDTVKFFLYSKYFAGADVGTSSTEPQSTETQSTETQSTEIQPTGTTAVTESSAVLQAAASETLPTETVAQTQTTEPSATTAGTGYSEEIKEYVRAQILEKYNTVKNGTEEFEKVMEGSDDYSYLHSYYPDGITMTKSQLASEFNYDGTNCKTGDLIMLENDSGVYLLKVIDFSQDDITDRKSELMTDKYNEFIKAYTDKVTYDEKMLERIKLIDFTAVTEATE